MKKGFARGNRNELQLKSAAVRILFLGLNVVFILCFLLNGVSPGASEAALKTKPSLPAKNPGAKKLAYVQPGRAPRRFVEVEICLDSPFIIEFIRNVYLAPQSPFELLDNPKRIRAQLPADEVQALVEQGAEVTILRNFILVGDSTSQTQGLDGDAGILATCSGTYAYDYSDLDVDIPDDGGWAGSGIDFSGASGGYAVTCVDVHYEIEASWTGILYAEMTDEDYGSPYSLVEGETGSIYGTETGISFFNGRAVDQVWALWAMEYYSSGDGYINYWWLKLYYQPEGYCNASGICDEYISRVEVGDIDNSSGCNGYSDYTALSTEMQIGQSYEVAVTNGKAYDGDQCGIWVDWNQDEDFEDAGEEIPVGGDIFVFEATITPPAGAAPGDTRMRVRITYTGDVNPCGGGVYGEVEDYTIIVTESGPPPTITGWEAAVTHGGGVGELWCPVEDNYIEPRVYGINKLRVYFDQTMDTSVTDPSVVSVSGVNNGMQPAPCSIDWVGNDCLVINFCSALPDGDAYFIEIGNEVVSQNGSGLVGSTYICLIALKGDANASWTVNAQDLLAIRTYAGQTIDSSNARYDVNCSGGINAQDLLAARPYAGNSAPSCFE